MQNLLAGIKCQLIRHKNLVTGDIRLEIEILREDFDYNWLNELMSGKELNITLVTKEQLDEHSTQS